MNNYLSHSEKERKYYENMLKVVGSLSKLFSESSTPFLHSRIAENLYCKSFNAENKSRDDSSIDAKIETTGIGIKTFMGSGNQKIAEFNKDHALLSKYSSLSKAQKIAELRNKRLEFDKRRYGLNYLIYHCIRREKGRMLICECPMDLINLSALKLVKETAKSLAFEDDKNQYTFNNSKSVLLKSFPKDAIVADFPVQILDDPFNILDMALAKKKKEILADAELTSEYIVLPLYSLKDGEKVVNEKSGLNQWNAKGRPRDLDEVYIPIPAVIHKGFPDFFPKRDITFTLKLPDGSKLLAKVCQDGSKALMSAPNKALGQWILRKVLQIPRGKLLTYDLLSEIGIDSVIIKKTGVKEYSIDFSERGTYKKFKDERLNVA